MDASTVKCDEFISCKVNENQIFYHERCVNCKLRALVKQSYLSKGDNEAIRGYGKNEKKFFSNKKPYPHLKFLNDIEKWDDFYKVIVQTLIDSNIEFNSLESLQISETLINKIIDINMWFSTIPIFIEMSRIDHNNV